MNSSTALTKLATLRRILMPVSEWAQRWAKPIIIAAAILVLLLTAWRASVTAPLGAHLTLKSGVWLTMGADLEHGVFYRPLIGPDGYGGTRYFPLQVALLGGLMKLGLPPITAGFVWTFASAAALMGGAAAFLRRLGAPGWFALAVGVLCLATRPVQDAIVVTEGDLLPAAFSLWGLAFCASLREEDGFRGILPASLFFALAFAAKASSVFGAGASVIWLLANGRRRQALQLVLLTSAIAGALIGAAQIASEGRFLSEIFACGSAGGTWTRALRAPLEMFDLSTNDNFHLLFFILLGTVLWRSGRACLRELPVITLAVTLVGTTAILSTPGTSYNHVLDFFVAMVIVVAAAVARRHVNIALGGVVLALICATVTIDRVQQRYSDDRLDRISLYRRIVEGTGKSRKPLLAADVMIPLAAGERPFVMDTFMLGVLCQKRPEIAAGLRDRLARCDFRAIVLHETPRHVDGKPELILNADPAITAAIGRAYYRAGRIGDRVSGYEWVYLPRESAKGAD